ncbi:MAG: hypothetical protein EBS89_03475 [Proteobacteria bacterium]|nr:hypothetical protein [Pseudomonadota bacterium]
MGKYDSNEVIVSGYGLPFLTDTDAAEGYLTDESVVPEDVETSIRRIAVLNDRVVKWIAANRRIPASNPNAPPPPVSTSTRWPATLTTTCSASMSYGTAGPPAETTRRFFETRRQGGRT